MLCRWKALDFAALKRSSVSFFDVQKPETAQSRWARARTRAAKVYMEFVIMVTIMIMYNKTIFLSSESFHFSHFGYYYIV